MTTDEEDYGEAVGTVPGLDAEVRAWVLTRLRASEGTLCTSREMREHLRACAELRTEDVWWSPEIWGCHTCAEAAKLEVQVSCPHSLKVLYEYGQLDHLNELLEQFTAWLARPADAG